MQGQQQPDFHAVEAEIRKHYPGALFTWDTSREPYLLQVMVEDVPVLGSVEPMEIASRGPLYRKFLEQMVMQIAGALLKAK
jgi:hypothetical protein